MSVNGIELAVGQQWLTTWGKKVTLQENPHCGTFVFRAVLENKEWNTVNREGKLWSSDYKPYLQTLIYNPIQPKQFSPKPGDKIICNNGEEFVCCTLEFLQEDGLAMYAKNDSIFAYQIAIPRKIYHKYDWMLWKMDGSADEQAWSIKEIIPDAQEVKQDVTEVMKTQVKTYTLNEVTNALICVYTQSPYFHDISTEEIKIRVKSLSSLLEEHLENPEYKLYLELKAKFEGKE